MSIVDDDESVREAIKSLLRSVGLAAEAFASGQEFLNSDYQHNTECLILDVRMPGMSGLQVHEKLICADCKIPVIFITAHLTDTDAKTRALQSGAIDFLIKPFSEEALLNDVYKALGSGSAGL
ncbi:MAG TPA: response regulator [Pyrinomonadaceae bacterium]|nr:response regulator [Pyrinomonadaceae bacterium]